MFFFSKKDPRIKKLEKKYRQLLTESYSLSRSNRLLSDQKAAEAEALLQEIDKLKQNS